jgi:hypothetical protein
MFDVYLLNKNGAIFNRIVVDDAFLSAYSGAFAKCEEYPPANIGDELPEPLHKPELSDQPGLSNAEKRKLAYENEADIPWGDEFLTADGAAQLLLLCFAEDEKHSYMPSLRKAIAKKKADVRKKYQN